MHHEVIRRSTASQMRALPQPIKLISFLFFVYLLGWGMVFPFLPIYFAEILGSFTKVGIVMGLLPFFTIIWALLFGGIVDRVPKKILILAMLILYIPMSYVLLSLKTLAHFIWFRVYHSFNATGLWVSSDAYVRRHSEHDQEAQSLALFDAAGGGALIAGAGIGGFLFTRLGYAYFWVVSIFVVLALLIAFMLPNHDVIKRKKFRLDFLKHEWKVFFSHHSLVWLSAFMFFIAFASSIIAMVLPLFLLEIGASIIEIGLIASLFMLPIAAEPYFSTFENKTSVVLWSMILAAIAFIAMFYLQQLLAVFVVSIILGVFLAAMTPIINGKVTRLMPKQEVGELSAVLFAIKGLGSGAGPIIAGIIADGAGLRYVFLVGFAIFLTLSIFVERFTF